MIIITFHNCIEVMSLLILEEARERDMKILCVVIFILPMVLNLTSVQNICL